MERKEKQTYRVMDLTPRSDQASKPAELIQVSGHQSLSLNARRSITLLWHNAHRQGIEEGKDYSIEMNALIPKGHKGREMVEEAILSLMQTIITVRHPDGSVRRVQFLGGNDMDSPDRPSGILNYSFDKRLIEILRDSNIWGKISLPVLMSLSSKYAISLYENVSQWAGLSQKISQVFELGDLREMLGVEGDKYEAFGALNKHVLKPIVQEINALAPFNISMLPMKTGKKVTHVRIGWWAKTAEEQQAAWKELQGSRVGRRARISKRAEYVFPPAPSQERLAREAQRLARMGQNTLSGDDPLIHNEDLDEA